MGWQWFEDRLVDDEEYHSLLKNPLEEASGGFGCLFIVICLPTSVFAFYRLFTRLLENSSVGFIIALVIVVLFTIIILSAYKIIILGFIIFLVTNCSIVNFVDHESSAYIRWNIIANFIEALPKKVFELMGGTFDAILGFLLSGFQNQYFESSKISTFFKV